VSDVITLTLRTLPARRLEVEGLTADRLSALSALDIARLPVWSGRRQGRLGDVFDVRGERSARVRVEGPLDQVDGLGAGMTGGELSIAGGAGGDVGLGMSGGIIDVEGDVGDGAGAGMSGGLLRVSGRAGARLGGALPGWSRGMTGGEIIVRGPAGDDAAARCRRGLVVTGGAGADAGMAMIAGTLLVLGPTGPHPGRGNRRGTILALGGILPPETYRYACTFRPPHVRVLLLHLRRRHGVAFSDEALDGRYRRFCGDLGEPGRGEILQWLGPGA
jgi:formylmethanofuran dehydrogenase subunit C